jgi:hypothetical protein
MDLLGGAANAGTYILVALAVVVLLIAFGLVVVGPLLRLAAAVRDAWLRRRLRATRDPR